MAYNKAKPILEKAEKSLENLDPKSVDEMKNFTTPHPAVILVGKIVLYIFKGAKVDLNSDKDNDQQWKNTKSMLGNPKRFVADLKEFSFNKA